MKLSAAFYAAYYHARVMLSELKKGGTFLTKSGDIVAWQDDKVVLLSNRTRVSPTSEHAASRRSNRRSLDGSAPAATRPTKHPTRRSSRLAARGGTPQTLISIITDFLVAPGGKYEGQKIHLGRVSASGKGFHVTIVEMGKLTRITAKSAGYTRARSVPLRRSTRLAEAARAETIANPAPEGESSLPYYVVESISEEDIMAKFQLADSAKRNASDADIVEALTPPRKRSRSNNDPAIDVAMDAVNAGVDAFPVHAGEELEESSVSVLDEDLSGEETAVVTQGVDAPTTATTEEEATSLAVVTQADAEPVQAGEVSKESDSVEDAPTEIDESCEASSNSAFFNEAPPSPSVQSKKPHSATEIQVEESKFNTEATTASLFQDRKDHIDCSGVEEDSAVSSEKEKIEEDNDDGDDDESFGAANSASVFDDESSPVDEAVPGQPCNGASSLPGAPASNADMVTAKSTNVVKSRKRKGSSFENETWHKIQRERSNSYPYSQSSLGYDARSDLKSVSSPTTSTPISSSTTVAPAEEHLEGPPSRHVNDSVVPGAADLDLGGAEQNESHNESDDLVAESCESALNKNNEEQFNKRSAPGAPKKKRREARSAFLMEQVTDSIIGHPSSFSIPPAPGAPKKKRREAPVHSKKVEFNETKNKIQMIPNVKNMVRNNKEQFSKRYGEDPARDWVCTREYGLCTQGNCFRDYCYEMMRDNEEQFNKRYPAPGRPGKKRREALKEPSIIGHPLCTNLFQ